MLRLLALQTPPVAPSTAPTDVFTPPSDPGEAANLLVDAVHDLIDGLLAALPLIAIGAVLFVFGFFSAKWIARLAGRGLTRTSADPNVVSLITRLLRLAIVLVVTLVALSVAGVNVGAFLAGLGIAGLALAFALQNILENFVSGILLLIRKPFRTGDQIRTGDFEGTVEEIDLRVTRIVDYDGETVLIPNADVFTSPLMNLTRRGSRRTRVMVGVDYRDDHDAAREVIRAAVAAVDGVMPAPPVEVLLTQLGDSSVDFEVRYWTAPDIASVRRTQDRVLAAAKSALATAGMTIPWPIRTLSFDNAFLPGRPAAVAVEGGERSGRSDASAPP